MLVELLNINQNLLVRVRASNGLALAFALAASATAVEELGWSLCTKRIVEVATSTMLGPDTVGTGSTPLSSNRHTTKESGERLLTTYGSGTVVGTAGEIDSTTGVDQEGLEVGLTLGKKLASVDGRTSHYRGVIAKTGTESGVVRGLTARAKEELSYTANVGLYEQNQQKQEKRERQNSFLQRQTQECDGARLLQQHLRCTRPCSSAADWQGQQEC